MASLDLAMQFSSADPLGRLDDLRKMIQKQPQRSDLRVYLFQVYCVQGEWTKAATQLDVLLELDPSSKPMVQTYREALKCEVLRRDVFAGKRAPLGQDAPTIRQGETGYDGATTVRAIAPAGRERLRTDRRERRTCL